MTTIAFYIFYGINYLITLLPLRLLYIISDIFYALVYYIAGYRRKVVATNLRNAFPEKSEAERKAIERGFYRHLADLFVETLKLTHMSKKQIKKRFRFNDTRLLKDYYDKGRDVIVLLSHYNNWEWLASFPLSSPYTGVSIYKTLTNKHFDRFMLELRTRYGVVALPMQRVLRYLVTARKNGTLSASALIADQTPPPNESAYWTTFLNQETGFYRGPEKISEMLDAVVFFGNITKVRRGYYEVDFILISEHPKKEEPGIITEKYVRMLEDLIRERPEYWLWSHRRWKYKKPVGND